VRFFATRWQWFAVLALIIAIFVVMPQDWWHRNHLPSAVVTTLQQADHFELLSLDPKLQSFPEEDSFHGYGIPSRVTISDANTRKRLISALRRGMRENSDTIAACFHPRHGIRAVRKGKEADLVICFECLQIQLFGDVQGEFLVSDSPQAFFDETLKAGRPR